MEYILKVTELAKISGYSKAVLFNLTEQRLITAEKRKNRFFYPIEAIEILAKRKQQQEESIVHLSYEGFVRFSNQYWIVEPFEYIDTYHDVTATCKSCGVTSTKQMRKYIEPINKGKSGCLNCYREYTQTEEFSKQMGTYSASADSEPRQRQKANLKKFHQTLSPEESAKLYGHEQSEKNKLYWNTLIKRTKEEKEYELINMLTIGDTRIHLNS